MPDGYRTCEVCRLATNAKVVKSRHEATCVVAFFKKLPDADKQKLGDKVPADIDAWLRDTESAGYEPNSSFFTHAETRSVRPSNADASVCMDHPSERESLRGSVLGKRNHCRTERDKVSERGDYDDIP